MEADAVAYFFDQIRVALAKKTDSHVLSWDHRDYSPSSSTPIILVYCQFSDQFSPRMFSLGQRQRPLTQALVCNSILRVCEVDI